MVNGEATDCINTTYFYDKIHVEVVLNGIQLVHTFNRVPFQYYKAVVEVSSATFTRKLLPVTRTATLPCKP